MVLAKPPPVIPDFIGWVFLFCDLVFYFL